ncbi:P-loop containing nucleoside triphosphate hydrolase protein [Mycena vulgaris]|nr:P-loop containing nucleoside triphosphate hydrolase protein [Mycena vulgaris]
MSTSTRNLALLRGPMVQTPKSSQSNLDWLAPSLITARPSFPEPNKVTKNRDDLKELCENIIEIIRIVQQQLSTHGEITAVRFKSLCEDLDSMLQDVLKTVKQLKIEPRGLSSRFKELVKLSRTTDEINRYRTRVQELRSNFLLLAAIDTNLQVHKVHEALATITLPSLPGAQERHHTNNCPPPSRIFRGRQTILKQMHQFFTHDIGKQHIFLLHGLGGSGKTQIALKFIEESSHFSDIFLIDASTTETIDTALKNIAAVTSTGSTAEAALQWLTRNPADWLLVIDNADDPRINLNNFFPRCNHGNILITSRNPGLRVYVGSDSRVSDMEETDAVKLLLKSAAQTITPGNKEIAAEIVKVSEDQLLIDIIFNGFKALWYFPLAIIQAGAFISKSGALASYLNLYAENQAQLLSERPDQSHDDYARTVYTTWQISFDQLSKPAATLLQLCSFLHHKGISEEIFSRASSYCFQSNGLSKEELHDPLEFLSQFSGPSGVWSSLRFMDVMNEITAYSLANFDPDGKLFSIHPLVHSWSRSTLADQGQYHYCMVAIVGMSISAIPNQDVRLASLKLLPHVDSLLYGNINISPAFRSDYRRLYFNAERPKNAEQLDLAVLEHRRSVLGEDHPDTLQAMGSLASTYHRQHRYKEAEELEAVVLEKQTKFLGKDHPDTLHTMGNLASTYDGLGKLHEAEQLEFVVLNQWRKLLGDDHPNTIWTMGTLASTYHNLGKFQEAEELQVVVLDKQRKLLADDHPDTLRTMGRLAFTYQNMGKLWEAEKLQVVVLEKGKHILGEEHPHTLSIMGSLASTYHTQGKLQEAEELWAELLDRQKALLGADHPDTLHTADHLSHRHHAME